MSIFSVIKNPKDWLAKQFIAKISKDVAEGNYGEKLKAAWWFVHDHGLWVGAGLEVIDFALQKANAIGVCASCLEYDSMLVRAGAFLISIGLVLNFHTSEQPVKPAPAA